MSTQSLFWRTPSKLLITIVIAAQIGWPLPIYGDSVALPDLGDESITVISPQQERQLGEDFMRQARQRMHFIQDPDLLDYVNGLGQKLVSRLHDNTQKYHFYLIEDGAINAFAVPGGHISLNTGLIVATESEGELASVVAHEIAHISQRHIPRIIAAQQRSSGVSLAALLAAIVLLGQGQVEAGEATIALSTAAMVQRQLNFTRGHEQEADRVGTQILADADFNPRAMPLFFQRLQNWSRLYETNLPEFLSTHPITSNRIAESMDRAQQYPNKKGADSPEFHHVRAKIRVMTAPRPADSVKQFRYNLAEAKFRYRDAERYGYALALANNQQYNEAGKEIAALRKANPNKLRYRIAEAEIAMASGDYKRALTYYEAAYRNEPEAHSLVHSYAKALLQTGQYRTASKILTAGLRRYPDDTDLYRMMATAAGENKDPFNAHYHMAEYYYRIDDLGNAKRQLEIAAKHAGNSHYHQARIDARSKEIRALMKQRVR